MMKDYQAKVEILQDKVASLENSLEEANQKLRLAENADQKKDDVSLPLSAYFGFF
jgi:prefoldin subunit 5